MNNKCKVFGGKLEVAEGDIIKVGSKDWWQWLENNSSFRYHPISRYSPFTVKKEQAKGRNVFYWYGYRKVKSKVCKRYIGKQENLTVKKLEEVAAKFDKESTKRPPSIKNNLNTQIKELEQRVEQLQTLVTSLEVTKDTLSHHINEQQSIIERRHRLPNLSDLQAIRNNILENLEASHTAFTSEHIKLALDKMIEEILHRTGYGG